MLDIEKLMREGKTLEEIGKLVTDEMNVAQEKIDKEKEEAKKVAEKQEKLTVAREAAITALTNYFTLVLPKVTNDKYNMRELVTESLDSLEDTIEYMKRFKIKVNGKSLEW